MPRRRRWTPVRGTANRVYDARERWLLAAVDLPARGVFRLLRPLVGPATAPDPETIREVLVLRLDRIGDVLMSLDALAELRAALPKARIRLAVGAWSAEIARAAPVDELLVWSAPWVGRASEGALRLGDLVRHAWALRASRLDLAIDLQGDVRASLLLWLSGARWRVGYANTGGAYLLSLSLPLDETIPWVEQNRRAVALATGQPATGVHADPLDAEDRAFGARLVANLGLESRRPVIGLHPSGGRRVKQWEVPRWASVARRLQREFGATLLVTGSAADTPLARAIAEGLVERPFDLTGKLSVRETLALIARLDLFLSPDTGPMHMACAVGTPSVAVFGPSDPGRYFSGGSGQPGTRHVVVREELWCAPCNLIRRPPAECDTGEPPECLRLVTSETVYAAAARLLRETGGYRMRGEA